MTIPTAPSPLSRKFREETKHLFRCVGEARTIIHIQKSQDWESNDKLPHHGIVNTNDLPHILVVMADTLLLQQNTMGPIA